MIVPSERRPGANLDTKDRTARHYLRQAGMSLGPDGRVGFNPLYEQAKEALEQRLVQVGTIYRRLRGPKR